jgi:allantoinase
MHHKKIIRKSYSCAIKILLVLGFLTISPALSMGAEVTDWVTGLPRQPIHVSQWPEGKKIAVCFVLYVEVWGQGQGPNFRPDMSSRKPDLVNESFREYGIEWGIPRVAALFKEQDVPLTIALNALFSEQRPEAWKRLRSVVPDAAIVAHGMNNSTEMLPLAAGMEAQEAYIRKTLDLIEKDTGVRPRGWSSPSVYSNRETFSAAAAAGITYTLDSMDSDVVARLITKAGPLMAIPYPVVTVDMGQYLTRDKEPEDMERLWIDYVTELVREAETDPSRDAMVVAIGIHPFVVGTPSGAAALRRVLENFKKEQLIWLTDTDAVMKSVGGAH